MAEEYWPSLVIQSDGVMAPDEMLRTTDAEEPYAEVCSREVHLGVSLAGE
jgi:hypothetical protein